MEIMRIGVDLAKNVFEVHGVDAQERVVVCKTLRRSQVKAFFAQLPPCQVGMESCGGAHYWGREFTRLGHEVRLMAPQFVKPYRKSDKNDRNDAQAICEAVGRPTMRFVALKSEEQQAVLTLHRARELMVRERTALVNQVRGLLQEYGIVLPQGRARVRAALPALLEDAENGLPDLAREVFAGLYDRLVDLDAQVAWYDRRVQALARTHEAARRLMELDGVGPLTATALVASVGDARLFHNGRQLAAWLGLVPRQRSSGGKSRHGRITKRGDAYLRTLLIHGARARLRHVLNRDDPTSRWAQALKERQGRNKAAVALAAKTARVAWALLARDEHYRVQPA
jgi:transposase